MFLPHKVSTRYTKGQNKHEDKVEKLKHLCNFYFIRKESQRLCENQWEISF